MIKCEEKDKSMAEVYDEYVRSSVCERVAIQIPQVKHQTKMLSDLLCFLFFIFGLGTKDYTLVIYLLICFPLIRLNPQTE